MMTKSSRLLISVILPILVLSGLIIKTEVEINQSKHLMLTVEGYDPRDLLRGHYINFRYKWDFDEIKTSHFVSLNKDYFKQDIYLCISKGSKVYPILLSSIDECDFKIIGNLRNPDGKGQYDFTLGIEKYYVPEKYSKLLEDELRSKKSQIKLAVNSQGRAVIMQLYIEGVPWQEIARLE